MAKATDRRRHAAQRRPLAAGVAAALLLALPDAQAVSTFWTIDTCSDVAPTGNPLTHAGALRWALANAASGDVIDLTQLTCGTISLENGELAITQQDLTLHGPGAGALHIDGAMSSRVINQSVPGGTLYIDNVSLIRGYATSNAAELKGGCIYSKGSLTLYKAQVYGCFVNATGTNLAGGGGVYAAGGLSMTRSDVSGNAVHVTGQGGSTARGGGVLTSATGDLFVSYSTIADNSVVAQNGYTAFGGGLFLRNGGIVQNSTISGNDSSVDGGGLFADVPAGVEASNHTLQLFNNTISHNTASRYYAGGTVRNAELFLANSTIAINHSSATAANTPKTAGFFVNESNNSQYGVTLKSNLIAGNTFGSSGNDFSLLLNAKGVTSANNVIVTAYANLFPPGTISGSCPLLGPLRDNGGPTRTQALLSGSVGIDQGSNDASLTSDQRGTPYTRVSNGTADAGAYEVQQDDVVFDANFDGCG